MAETEGDIPLPPHAYVPGQNARHAEDHFDPIKASVVPGMDAAALSGTAAFRAGLAYLDAGYFWECHEVLEAVWMQTAPDSPEREMVQALIQLANARLKVAMERPRAALRLCDMTDAHLAGLAADRPILGVLPGDILHQTAELRAQLSSGKCIKVQNNA